MDDDDDDDDAALRVALLDAASTETHCSRDDVGDSEGRKRSSSPRGRRRRPSRRSPSAPMSTLERLVLPPMAKWAAHGRFPFKASCHVALLALTLLQMALFDAQNAAYMRATHRNWAYFFLPPSQDVGVAPRFERALYTVNQTRDAVFFVRDAYFAIANASLANYEYARDPEHADERVRRLDMTVVSRRAWYHHRSSMALGDDDDTSSESGLVMRRYRVAATPKTQVGPFRLDMDAPAARRLLRALVRVELAMHLRDRQHGRFYDECFDWTVHVSITRGLDGQDGGGLDLHAPQLRARVDDAQVRSCTTLSFWQALRWRPFVWLHVTVAMVTTVYLVLCARALRRSFALVTAVTAGADVPLSVRLQLLNRLQLVVFVALVLLLASCVWSLAYLKVHVPIGHAHRLLQGVALLLLWSSLVGYLEHNREIYSIVLTLRWGAPRVLQFLVGVSPIFLGFALFGTVCFGARVKMFGSLSASMMTLFAVLNGDVILDTVDALALHGFGVSGKLYVYAFIALFIYVVLNIFIAIVEEAFFATRRCRRALDVVLSDPAPAFASASASAASTAEASTHPPSTSSSGSSADASSEMAWHLLRLLTASERARAASEAAAAAVSRSS